MDERKDARTHARTDGQTDGRTWATLNALPHSTNSGGIKISIHYICEKKGGGGKEGCSKEPSHRDGSFQCPQPKITMMSTIMMIAPCSIFEKKRGGGGKRGECDATSPLSMDSVLYTIIVIMDAT